MNFLWRFWFLQPDCTFEWYHAASSSQRHNRRVSLCDTCHLVSVRHIRRLKIMLIEFTCSNSTPNDLQFASFQYHRSFYATIDGRYGVGYCKWEYWNKTGSKKHPTVAKKVRFPARCIVNGYFIENGRSSKIGRQPSTFVWIFESGMPIIKWLSSKMTYIWPRVTFESVWQFHSDRLKVHFL